MTPEVAERLTHLNEALNSGIALKRRIIEDLRPSSLSNLGLVAALEILVREWGQRSDVKVDAEFEPVTLRPAGELTVYRLVQEALTNISQVRARDRGRGAPVVRTTAQVRVSVRDNGVGFDTRVARTSAHGLLGHALSGRGRGRSDDAGIHARSRHADPGRPARKQRSARR